MTAIVDYGVGNLFSLESSFAAIGEQARVTSDPEIILAAERVILPGVGAFGDAAEKLRNKGLDRAVTAAAEAGKPLMGICLGMQLLFEKSFEYGEHAGLRLLKGVVRPIREILEEQRKRGGLITVVSHSFSEHILRDYRENGLPEPDLVFGWEYPDEQRKPRPWALYRIMEKFGLRPEEMLVVDDLKPGYDMARAAGVPFAAAGWANDIPEIVAFMRANSPLYFKTTEELGAFLFPADEAGKS